MQDIETREWAFDAAQTNATLLGDAGADLVPTGKRMAVTFCKAVVGGSVTTDVSCRVGFSSTGSLVAVTPNSLSGIPKMCLSHSGIRPGGGEVNAPGDEPFCIGGDGESPIMTCSVPTAGQLRLIMGFTFIDT